MFNVGDEVYIAFANKTGIVTNKFWMETYWLYEVKLTMSNTHFDFLEEELSLVIKRKFDLDNLPC